VSDSYTRVPRRRAPLGVGEDGVPAFTKDGIENLCQIVARTKRCWTRTTPGQTRQIAPAGLTGCSRLASQPGQTNPPGQPCSKDTLRTLSVEMDLQSSGGGTQAGRLVLSCPSWTPRTQIVRCPRNRGNFTTTAETALWSQAQPLMHKPFVGFVATLWQTPRTRRGKWTA
jgi:hypothetical protein